jgi:hypothetical protein
MDIMGFVKRHPVEIGLGAVAIVVLYFILSKSGGGSSDNGAAAYYAAQAQQSNNSAAIQIAQDNDTAQTAQVQIAGTTSIANNTLAANVSNNVTAANLSAFEFGTSSAERISANDTNFDSTVLQQISELAQHGSAATSPIAATGFNVHN